MKFRYLLLVCVMVFIQPNLFGQDNPTYIYKQLEVLRSNPNSLVTLENIGDAYAKQNNFDEALIYYEKLVKLKPQIANYHYKFGGALGMIAKNSSKFKAIALITDIREAFETALKLDPKHIDSHYALIEYNLQLPAIAGGSETKAKEYANALYNISRIDGYLAHGHIAEHYKNYTLAEKYYKSAVIVGKSKTAYQKLSDLYKKMQQPAKAAAVMAEFQSIQS